MFNFNEHSSSLLSKYQPNILKKYLFKNSKNVIHHSSHFKNKHFFKNAVSQYLSTLTNKISLLLSYNLLILIWIIVPFLFWRSRSLKILKYSVFAALNKHQLVEFVKIFIILLLAHETVLSPGQVNKTNPIDFFQRGDLKMLTSM